MARRLPAVFIVGAGRVGGALALAFERRGYEVATSSRTARSATAARLAGIPGTTFPRAKAKVLFLCVPDAAVAAAAEELACEIEHGQIVAHCSGALGLEPLAALAAKGAHVGSLHPLCAVPTSLAPIAGAVAAIDGDPAAARALTRLARDAGLLPFRLAPEKRALYHAAAVLASNGLVGLASEARGLLVRCGLKERDAVAALLPLMSSALHGIRASGLPAALTGPVARGDFAVIEQHRAALKRDEPGTLALYDAITRSLVKVALGLPTGDREGKKKIAQLVK